MARLFNNFSKETLEVFKNMRNIAEEFGYPYITSSHLFLGILRQKNTFVHELLEFMGFDLDELGEELEKLLALESQNTTKPVSELPLTPVIKNIIEEAENEMKANNWNTIETVHLLLGVLKTKDAEINEILKASGISYNEVKSTLDDIIKNQQQNITNVATSIFNVAEKLFNSFHGQQENPNKTKNNPSRKRNKSTPALDAFGRCLTDMSKEGKIDPVIGRDNETKRIWQILARRKKNNVAIIGASGVGKTAIVEGLANCLAKGDVPNKLRNKEIIQVDVSGMVAGSKYRGEFEKKLKAVIEETIQEQNIILFFDELHTIIGSGNSEGAMDGANILKPYLSSGEIQVIGATTSDEYQKYFEKDSALVRRFQKLHIEPPNKENTIKILKGLKKHYETFHNVTYSNEVLELIAELSDRYITTQTEPDRSINTLDEVGSKLALIDPENIPPDITKVKKEIEILNKKKDTLVANKQFEEAAMTKLELEKFQENLEKLNKEHLPNETKIVTDKDVREVFSLISNIPVESVQCNSGEAKRYLDMPNELNKKIINQEDAIQTIAKVIKRKKAGIENTNKPAVLLFAGSTGCGKTYSAKKLAEFLFHDEKKLVFLNGAEYADKTAVNRLTSSNPGYVGYGESTDFEYIRNNPYSILLVDECEKMHSEIWQIFLRIFEEGELTTANGKLINFKNCVIILTSNLGSQDAQKSLVGFNIGTDKEKQENRKIKYEDAIKKYFKPEILNRISNIVVFNDLIRDDLKRIVDLELNPLRESLAEKNVKLLIKSKVVDFIIDHSDDPEGKMGARPIKRSIENHLNDPISDIILGWETLKSITVTVKKDALVLTPR